MNLLACGVNHKSAPLAVRERIAVVPEQMPEPLHDFVSATQVPEAAMLSTCNRIELYCSTSEQIEILPWLAKRHGLDKAELAPHIYYHQGEAAIRHMLRVASGLDSMVLGEPQILGQMKSAFEMAVSAGTVGPQLQRLFQYIFATTKTIRHETGIGRNAVSIAFAAAKLAKHIFSDLSRSPTILIGAGATIEMILRYLQKQGVQDIWIANRTVAKADALANGSNVQAMALADLPQHLAKADIVITATAAPLPIVGKGLIERALKIRRHRPMLFIDLAVPRNIEPEAAQLPDVYLYSLDDLQKIITENQRDRQLAAEQAEGIITLHVERFMRWLSSLDAVGTIRVFRNKINTIRDQELAKALRSLQLGYSPDEVLRKLAHNLTNKVLHTPTIAIREASNNKQMELLACARSLFALE